MIRIVHISPVFHDNWSYQENLLSSIQSMEQDFEVTVISSKKSIVNYKAPLNSDYDYYLDKVRIFRLDFIFNFFNRFYIYKGLKTKLNQINPDIIMIHGLQMLPVFQILSYKRRNVKCRIYADLHADYRISGTNILSRVILHRIIWKSIIKYSSKYIDEIYYTRPSVRDFSIDFYSINPEKFKPLYLGTEYDLPCEISRSSLSKKFREELNIRENDFLIITGGKISADSQIHVIIEAINKQKNKSDIHFVLFGTIEENYLNILMNTIDRKLNFHFIGWKNSAQVYEAFIASDLSIFLGRHSVLWEQAVGLGVPILIRYQPDREYLNCNENVHFIFSDNIEELIHSLRIIQYKKPYYTVLKDNSLLEGAKQFNFKNIVKQLNEKWRIT